MKRQLIEAITYMSMKSTYLNGEILKVFTVDVETHKNSEKTVSYLTVTFFFIAPLNSSIQIQIEKKTTHIHSRNHVCVRESK